MLDRREPIDRDMVAGKAASVLEHYRSGLLGEPTTRLSLKFLGYDEGEVRKFLMDFQPPPHKR